MKHNRKTESGQAAVILAIAFVGLLAFSALAIDGGNAYLTRRNAQNAADAASMSGTRELHQILRVLDPDERPLDPDPYLRQVIVDAAQRNGVPDTNDNPADVTNDNVEAWYVNEDGELFTSAPVGWFYVIPPGARGIAVTAHIPFDTFIAHIVDRDTMKATTSAGSIFTERGGSVSATIYANATDCDPNTLTLNGSHQVIGGGIHSNGDVHINGNESDPSVYSGTLEYVTDAQVQGAIIVNPPDNQPTQVPPRVLPPLFDIADFAPEGVRAEAAGDYYYYFASADYPVKVRSQDLRDLGLLDHDGNLEPGLYFADTKFELNGTLIGTEGVTFVARETISLSCSDCFFTKWEPQLLFFAVQGYPGACNEVAISISASETQWFGLVYAPYGGVNMSSSGNLAVWGSIVGYTVDLSGSQIEVHYRPELDPPIPPKVVLIW
jgi:hypothetical protein